MNITTSTKKLKFYIALLSLLLTNGLYCNNYYFSSSIGSDSYTPIQAQNPNTPWKTLAKLNSIILIVLPGDSVLFKSGETFYGSFTVTVSGSASLPIVFSSYGVGAKPTITGLTALNAWTAKGGNIWEADCPSCGTEVNTLVMNDSLKVMGRYPNYSDPNKGYLNFESHNGNTQITDNELTNSPNWTGAELVIRKNDWIIDRALITQHLNTIINYTLPSIYSPVDNWGYFIQNHPSTLDQYGEWYYNSATKKILLFCTINPSSLNVNVSTRDNFIYLNGYNNLVFNNITFKGSNKLGLSFFGANYIKITNCDFLFSGMDAVDLWLCNHTTFKHNKFNFTNNNALKFKGDYNIIEGNIIKNTAVNHGQGQSGDATYSAISISGDNNAIQLNSIDSIGYVGVNFNGNNCLIKNNFIRNFCMSKDDGGAIYTWNVCPSLSAVHINRKVKGNIILNGLGAPQGKNIFNQVAGASGIYLDNNTMGVEVVDNTVASCTGAGIFLNTGHDNNVRKNTVFNNHRQLLITAGTDNCGPNVVVTNNYFTNNIFFAKLNIQSISNMVKNFADPTNSISQFGLFDTNYYCRPVNEEGIINIEDLTSNNVIALSQWKTIYNKDNSSKITPIQIATYTLNSLVGVNKFSNGTFSSNIAGLYSTSPADCSPSWDATSGLDGGSLKVTVVNGGNIVIGIGAIDATKKYILRFSLKGTKNNRSISTGLRYSLFPYSALAPFQNCKLTIGRSENEFLFSPSITESNASIQFDIDNGDGTLWLDNLELFEANIDTANLDNNIRFEYNETTVPKTITLTEQYIDVKNNYYVNNLTLQPYTSVILLKLPSTSTVQSVLNNTLVQDRNINIYPNPASTLLNFNSKNYDLTKIVIYDLIGREIAFYDYSKQIDVSALSNGIYIVRISNKNSEFIDAKKIIIQR